MAQKILKEFGRKVKDLRRAKNWTQEELAKRAGLHRTYVGSIERCERNISLINISKIAKAFDVGIQKLL